MGEVDQDEKQERHVFLWPSPSFFFCPESGLRSHRPSIADY